MMNRAPRRFIFEFLDQEVKEPKGPIDFKAKYEEALQIIEQMKRQKMSLHKEIRILEQYFNNLSHTTEEEAKRKDKIIEDLRKENNDLYFRHQRLLEKSKNEKLSVGSRSTSIGVQYSNPLCSNESNEIDELPVTSNESLKPIQQDLKPTSN